MFSAPTRAIRGFCICGMAGLATAALVLSSYAERGVGHSNQLGGGATAPPPRQAAGVQRSPASGLARAIPRPDGAQAPHSSQGGIAGGPSYATGFEPQEGFVPGFIDGQNGWAAFAISSDESHIDTADPLNGVQHLRLSREADLANGATVGAFSPNLGIFTETSGSVSVEIKINGGGARDYQIVPQSPTEGQVVTRIELRRTGDIRVLEDNGAGGAVFADTGFDWVADEYKNVTFNLDAGAGQFTVFYDGVLVYTNNGPGLPFATAIQEVVLSGLNGAFAEDGDYDDFSIANDPAPTGACCNFDGASGCSILTADDCAATGFTSTYLGNGSLCGDCPLGACCNYDGMDGCMVTTPEECGDTMDAFYLGDDTDCLSCPAVPPTCGPGAGDCNEANGTPGCEDIACCALLCASVQFCCVVEWDDQCAEAACDGPCQPPPACGACGAGVCFEAGGGPFCDDNCGPEGLCLGCCQTVCDVDPFCCDTDWDALCVGEAMQLCGCTPQDAPPNDDCDTAIAIGLGDTAVTNVCGTSGGPDHDTCNDTFVTGLGIDVWYSYDADFTGALNVTPMVDAAWTTQLAIYDGCDCLGLEDPPYVCAPLGGTATVPVTSGTCYLIRLGGTFDGPTGAGTLQLAAVPDACVGGTGNCNAPHANPGCDDLSCCATVCLMDATCCNAAWDQSCADLADASCAPALCGPLDLSSADLEEPELCGEDLDGGCNTTPPAFVGIVNGQVVHGTAWAELGSRDTDWYRIDVSTDDDPDQDGLVDIYYNIRSELPMVTFLIDDQNNPPGCVDGDGDGAADNLDTPGTTGYSQTCVQVGIGLATVAAPGQYYVFAGTGDAGGNAIFEGYPCSGAGPASFGNDYLLCVNVVDSGTPFDPACGGSGTVSCPQDCGDMNGQVDTVDFLALLGQWSQVGTSCDMPGTSAGVDTVDFLQLLGAWGPCN